MADFNSDCTATPSFPVQEVGRAFDVKEYPFADRKMQKLLLRSTKQRRWHLRFENQTQAQIDSLRTFYDARFGSYESFYWDVPGTTETNLLVYFIAESLKIEFKSVGVFDASCDFVETA